MVVVSFNIMQRKRESSGIIEQALGAEKSILRFFITCRDIKDEDSIYLNELSYDDLKKLVRDKNY